MDLRTVRIRNLRAYLDAHCNGNRAELARRAGRAPSQFTDLFAKGSDKSFGEKLARDLEKKLGLADMSLDMNPFEEQAVVRHAPGRWPFAFAQHRFDLLRPDQKHMIEELVERMVIGFEAERGPTPHGTGHSTGHSTGHGKVTPMRRRRG